jgi:hypothetical protein
MINVFAYQMPLITSGLRQMWRTLASKDEKWSLGFWRRPADTVLAEEVFSKLADPVRMVEP